MRRSTRRVTFVALVVLTLGAAGAPTAHASCSVEDVVCQADGTIGAGAGFVADTEEPVDTPIDDTLDPVIDEVIDHLDGFLGGDPVDLPDPIGGGGGGHGTGPPIDGQPPGPTSPGVKGTTGGPAPERAGIAGPVGASISAASGIAPAERVDRTSGHTLGEALGSVARSLAIVLALFGLAVAFVAIQDRLDRTDPRLALAPVESDVVEFT